MPDMVGSTVETVESGSQGTEMMAVMWSMTTFATLLVIARVCIRQRILRNFGVDDWLIGASMVRVSFLRFPTIQRTTYDRTYLIFVDTLDLWVSVRCDHNSLCCLWIWTTHAKS